MGLFGQTGSGKTFTMDGLIELAAHQIFKLCQPHWSVGVGCVEVAGPKVHDLLNDKALVTLREDGTGNLALVGCATRLVHSAPMLMSLLQQAAASRSSHATGVHNDSSRSHAVYRIMLLPPGDSDLDRSLLPDNKAAESAVLSLV